MEKKLGWLIWINPTPTCEIPPPLIENHRLRDTHRTTRKLASLANCHNKFLHSFSPVHAKSVGEPAFCHIREGIEMISKKLLVELYTNAKWDEGKQSKLS